MFAFRSPVPRRRPRRPVPRTRRAESPVRHREESFLHRGIRAAPLVLAVLLILLPTPGERALAEPQGPVRPLEQLFDNSAVSPDTHPGRGHFDRSGHSLSAGDLTAAGWTPGRTLRADGAIFRLPDRTPGQPDNVVATGQSVRVHGSGTALSFLVAGTGGAAQGTGTVRYRDGSVSHYSLRAPDWRKGPRGPQVLTLPHVNAPDGQLADRARLYVVTVPLVRGREVDHVKLPYGGGNDLHVFAVSVQPAATGWTGAWSAATAGRPKVGPWQDRTLRLVVHTSTGGSRVRVRLDNTFASKPVHIGDATIAVQDRGATARSAPRPLRFGGHGGTTIAAGAQALSDPLGFEVPAGSNLLISFHLPRKVASAPVHRLAMQTSYVSERGDHTKETSDSAYTGTITTWPLLAGVDVSGGPGSVVVLGDSVTEAKESTMSANHRWPDLLAARLRRQSAVPAYGVLNQAVSSNRIASDRYPGEGVHSDTGGVSALHRLERDVLAQTSARTVVVLMGVNDLRWGASPDEVMAGLHRIADRSRARGLRVVAATLTPCKGEHLCTADVDARRQEVNKRLRSGSGFDAVLDFDAVVRDPGDHARLAPRFDSGDHLHSSDRGLAALADSVDLRLLAP